MLAEQRQQVEREIKDKAPEDELSDDEDFFRDNETAPGPPDIFPVIFLLSGWCELSQLRKALERQNPTLLEAYFKPSPIEVTSILFFLA